MDYIIYVHDSQGEEVMHVAPVPAEDSAYLEKVIQELRPLSDDDYADGVAAILSSEAPQSYVLSGTDVLWCMEWDPGLIVVRLSPDQTMDWAAVRSTIPDFGGRPATEKELAEFDEDAPDPQYNLVFNPWDAQSEADERQAHSFVPADEDVESRFADALAHANELSQSIDNRSEKRFEAWAERCQENLAAWCGDGIRIG